MCTLSFVPRSDGYAVGMNRDELRSRPVAHFPKCFERNGVAAVYPSESQGGTWVAVNTYGLLFALLNWYSMDIGTPATKERSRGELIPRMIFESDFRAARIVLTPAKLQGIFPFRLIGIDPEERIICEWHWDGRQIAQSTLPWVRNHWFSSSLSDAQAEEQRRSACIVAGIRANPEGPDWLAELHRSHRPASGPYSICVHRPDAATASYTEISFNSRAVSMCYVDGSPCEVSGFHDVIELPRTSSQMPGTRLVF